MCKIITNTLPYNNNWQLINDNFKSLLKELKTNDKYIKVTYKTMEENNKKYGKIFVTVQHELTEIDFVNEIKHILEIKISNMVFDKFYNKNNYDDIVNNMSNYITLELIQSTIENIKDNVKSICKIYELPCKIELGFHKIYGIINSTEYELYNW